MLVTIAESPVPKLLDSVSGLPWAAHVAVALMLAAGLVLWCSGRHVLRPVVGFIAGAVGALAGFGGVVVLAPGAGVSPLVGGLAGLVLGLLAGFLLYRVAVGMTFGLALGSGAAVAALAVLSASLPGTVHSESTFVAKASDDAVPLVATLRDLATKWPAHPPQPPPLLNLGESPADVARMSGAVREFQQSLRYACQFAWEDMTTRQRIIILASAAAGLVMGFVLGVALPAWGAAAVTALVGAAIWLPAAVWLLHAAATPGLEPLDQLAPTGWTIVWLAAASVGLGLQWMGLMKPAKRPEPPATA